MIIQHRKHFFTISAVKAHEFFMEETWDSFKQIFDAYMFDASKVLPYLFGL